MTRPRPKTVSCARTRGPRAEAGSGGSGPPRIEKTTDEPRLILPDGRWSIAGTWLWRCQKTGRFARVDLAEAIYRARWREAA